MRLPSSLSRSAVIATFDKLAPVAWEHLFEFESKNGLRTLRVEGDFKNRAYYSTKGIIHWLIRNDRYTIEEISRITIREPEIRVRTHVLAA